jgi:hypothetical protein
MSEETAIEAEILRQTASRGSEKSICPSEVAQAMGPDWRSKLSAVRRAAIRLAEAGRIDILRKGRKVDDPKEVRGVIRLRVAGASTAEPDA